MKNPLSKIEQLKRKAKSAYLSYHSTLDGLSCGRALGEHVSSSALRNKIEFNEAMDALAKLDPTTPTGRL